MLDVQKYSEAKYMELQALVFELAHEFRDQWEADPFGDPNLVEFMQRAEDRGNEDTRDELGYVLEVYVVYFAPTPKLTDEQMNERMDKIKELTGEHFERLVNESQGRSQGKTDGDSGSTN